VDVFGKCGKWTDEHVAAIGRDCYFRTLDAVAGGTEADFDGRRVIVASSHDYLGLSSDPRVREAAITAIRRHGTSLGASRAASGTRDLHREFEHRVAVLLDHESAMVLPSGFQANLMLAPLLGEADRVFTDVSNHASLTEAVELGSAREHRYLHGDMDHLEELLGAAGPGAGKIILTDGIFSVDGDICDLPAISDLAGRHGARVVVDSSHDLGLLGARGAGAPEHFGLRADVVTAALSKSLASVGGVIAGPARVLRYLRNHSRTAIFTAAVSPANVAAAMAALDIAGREPERRVRALDVAERLHNGLRALGYDTGASVTPVVPVRAHGHGRCLRMWRHLCDAGVFTTPLTYPGVRAGREILRVTLTAAHTDGQLDAVLAAFAELARVEDIRPTAHSPVRIARPRAAPAVAVASP